MSRQFGPRIALSPRPPASPVPTRLPFSFVHINKCGGTSVGLALGIPKRHATARALRREIGAEAWARRFTFAIVRNPFDRVVSLYYYRMRRDYQGLGDRHLNVNAWIAAVWQAGAARYDDGSALNRPCTYWLVDEAGDLLVDTVVRLEDLDTGWDAIAARLGVDVVLPAQNRNPRPAYRDVLTPASRAIIEAAFAEDLARFGYDY